MENGEICKIFLNYFCYSSCGALFQMPPYVTVFRASLYYSILIFPSISTELSFERKVYPLKLEIYETYHPGCVVRVLACDRDTESDVDAGHIR